MAKSRSGGNNQKLNRQTKPSAAIQNATQGRFGEASMYTPDWDNPKVQHDRITKREDTPQMIGRGPSGIAKRGQ